MSSKHSILESSSLTPFKQAGKKSRLTTLITPTFPFNAPPTQRKNKADAKLLENPKPTAEIIVPSKPSRMTFFLPKISESAALPQAKAVQNCAAVNPAVIHPA